MGFPAWTVLAGGCSERAGPSPEVEDGEPGCLPRSLVLAEVSVCTGPVWPEENGIDLDEPKVVISLSLVVCAGVRI